MRPIGSVQASQSHPDGEWHVRTITGAGATKAYRCPGCEQGSARGWRTSWPGVQTATTATSSVGTGTHPAGTTAPAGAPVGPFHPTPTPGVPART